ncbi:MAG: hypothetical protein N3F63_08080 [Thermoplasmata archaeon]|nr:hypothetical protein [Thermoplasmata archaeon]
MAEIRDDIRSRAADAGVKTPADEEKFVRRLEKPAELAKRYIQIHGISPGYLALLSAAGIFLAFLSVPVIPLPDGIYVYPESLAALAVLLLTIYVVWVFIRFPSKWPAVGCVVFSSRILIYLVYAFCFGIGFDVVDSILFFITTAGVVAVGFAALYFSREEKAND